jgi:hypothetical protein
MSESISKSLQDLRKEMAATQQENQFLQVKLKESYTDREVLAAKLQQQVTLATASKSHGVKLLQTKEFEELLKNERLREYENLQNGKKDSGLQNQLVNTLQKTISDQANGKYLMCGAVANSS